VPSVFCSAHLKAFRCIARSYLTFYDKRPQQRKIGTRRKVFFFSKKSLNGHQIRGIKRDCRKDVIGLGRRFISITSLALLVDNGEVKLIFRHAKQQLLNSPNDKILISL
jgi:hypothetical protein